MEENQQTQLTRHEVRQMAFKALFALVINPEQSKMSLKNMLFENHSVDNYYDVLVNGIPPIIDELDSRYSSFIKTGWNLDRLTNITKTALRLAIYEMDERIDIPQKVAIDEALQLLKDFGDDEEKSLVNGILGKYVSSRG
jgi:N utilization substance protein B